MYRKFCLIASCFLIAAGLSAAPITPDEALARASKAGPKKARSLVDNSLKLVKSTYAGDGVASAYIFTPASGEGYTVLSADDRAFPVLGYSTTGSFDASNIPPQMEWWINNLAKQAMASNGNVTSTKPNSPAEWTEVPILCKTTWNQDAPYNLQAPTIGTTQAPTGCVATSFAQLMKYFNYPEKGKGNIRYTDSSGIVRSMFFNRENFLWDLMLDSYPKNGYTDEQANAVAYLMKACGYAVEMGYGASSSGAVSNKLANAAIKYFNYDKNAYYTEREFYNADQWATLVYNNIKNVGPVIYDGRSIDGGHSFICDGYDGNGYFHFNWGWGGSSDGYYVLDSLNPESQGIGGAEGGFNYSQGATFGLQPPTENAAINYARMRVYGNVKAFLSGNTLTFTTVDGSTLGWGNGSFRTINVTPGVIITNLSTGAVVDNVAGTLGNMSTISLDNSRYYPSASEVVTLPELADGTYKVTAATKDNEYDDSPWLPMLYDWGCSNYCLLNVANGVKTVTSVGRKNITVESGILDSPLYLGRNARLVCKFKNETTEPLTLCYSPVLYRDGKMQYQGDMMLVSVGAGDEIEKTALVAFYQVTSATSTGYGTYELKLMNRADNSIIGSFGEYEMSSVGSTTALTLNDFFVENADQQDVTSGSRTFKNTYMVADASDFDVYFKYTVKTGYFDTSVRIIAARYNAGSGSYEPFDDNLYYSQPFLGQGDSREINLPLDFTGHDLGSVYRLSASWLYQGRNTTLGSLYVAFKNSGIDGVELDDADNAEYYNLQGMRLENPQPGQVVIRKTSSGTEKIIFEN